jgi:hypothetical protein
MRRISKTLLLGLAVLLATWLTLTGLSLAGDKTGSKDKIKALQKERLAAATEAYKLTFERLKGLLAQPLECFQSCKLLFEARLDLAETKEERIKAYEQYVTDTSEIARLCEVFGKNGQGTKADMMTAKVHHLQAQILLEKAKQAK